MSAIDTQLNCNLDTYLIIACCLWTDRNSFLQCLWFSTIKISLCKYTYEYNI